VSETDPSLPDLTGFRVAIVFSERDEPSARLAEAAANLLRPAGVEVGRWPAPAAFEVAQLAAWIAHRGEVDGIVACATIIRGETSHDHHLAASVTNGLLETAMRHRIPVGNAVLTVNNRKQADARSGEGDRGNRGEDAARAVAFMLRYKKKPAGLDLGPNR